MSLFKRPNDVWLRIWLIILWLVLGLVDALVLIPFADSLETPVFSAIVHPVIFGPIITAILVLVWVIFKRPDCVCWDDIQVKPSTKKPKWQQEVEQNDWEQEEG